MTLAAFRRAVQAVLGPCGGQVRYLDFKIPQRPMYRCSWSSKSVFLQITWTQEKYVVLTDTPDVPSMAGTSLRKVIMKSLQASAKAHVKLVQYQISRHQAYLGLISHVESAEAKKVTS